MRDIIVEVCAGTHCTMMGAMDIIDAIGSLGDIAQVSSGSGKIIVRPVHCAEQCRRGMTGPIVFVDGIQIQHATSEAVMAALMEKSRLNN